MRIEDYKLLPCPFCGKTMILKRDYYGKFWRHRHNKSCPCVNHVVSSPKAVKAWNSRALLEAVEGK